jgi:hypothetical protein
MKYKISYLVLIISILGFISCELEYDRPPANKLDTEKILKIEDIYQIYQDSGDNYKFTESYNLYATVTMDDYSGNIYKEAYVQDETGGINLYRLDYSELLKQGDYVRINLKDVIIKYYSGKMELVFEDLDDCGNQLIIQNSGQELTPTDISISDLVGTIYDCELVRFSNVQFVDSDLSLTYADMNGSSSQNRTLEDCLGNTIIVRNSDYSDFAADSIPQGNGSIIGIATTYIDYNEDTIRQLLIRSLDEVNLDGQRCE